MLSLNILLNINPKHKISLNNWYFVQKSISCNIRNFLIVYNIINWINLQLLNFEKNQYWLIFVFWICYRKLKSNSISDYWQFLKTEKVLKQLKELKQKLGKFSFQKLKIKKNYLTVRYRDISTHGLLKCYLNFSSKNWKLKIEFSIFILKFEFS